MDGGTIYEKKSNEVIVTGMFTFRRDRNDPNNELFDYACDQKNTKQYVFRMYFEYLRFSKISNNVALFMLVECRFGS